MEKRPDIPITDPGRRIVDSSAGAGSCTAPLANSYPEISLMCEVFSRSSMQPFDQQPRSRGQYPTSYTPAESAPSHPYFGPYNIPSTQDLQLPRPILPPMLPSIARHSPSSVSSKSDDPHCRKKRQQIPAACESCRKRKGKVGHPLMMKKTDRLPDANCG